MASRQFRNQSFGLEAMPVRLFAKVTIGASGAPTLVANSSKGVKSVTRNSAGDYTITLGDSYVAILDVDVTVQNATGIPAAGSFGLKTAGTNVNTTGAGTVELVFSAPTSSSVTTLAATDPANGDILWIELSLSNSNL